eukprot:GFUD01016513.1.p1 GENE.GFUD01016513.1~~GFUD01016513.1.p1  ORF type:complete len:272 (-),score=62.74 GFUD01016513.1:85-900(-)
MASSDIVNIPPGTLAYVSYYIILPLVMFVHAIVGSVLSCMETTVTSITPVVRVGVNSAKAKMKKFGITSLAEKVMKKVESNVNTAVFNMTAAVEKVSSLALCVKRVPQLAVAWTPSTAIIIGTVQNKATSYGVSTIGYMASFSLAQVVLKVADTGLEVLGQTLKISGVSDGVWRRMKRFQISTSTIRMWGVKMARTDIVRKMEEVSTFGVVLSVVVSLKVLKEYGAWRMELWRRWLVLRRVEIAGIFLVAVNAVLLSEKFSQLSEKFSLSK